MFRRVSGHAKLDNDWRLLRSTLPSVAVAPHDISKVGVEFLQFDLLDDSRE